MHLNISSSSSTEFEMSFIHDKIDYLRINKPVSGTVFHCSGGPSSSSDDSRIPLIRL